MAMPGQGFWRGIVLWRGKNEDRSFSLPSVFLVVIYLKRVFSKG
jgi:hypothetical protein